MTLSGETVMTALNADTINVTEAIESITIPSTTEPMTAIVAEETVEDVNEAFETLSVDTNEEELADGTAESVDDVMEEFDRLTEINNEDSVESTIEEFERARDILTEAAEEESTLIPENSITTLEEDTTARFSGALWFKQVGNSKVTIIGQGGIGSWTSLIVARLGIQEMATFDGDRVEAVNMAGQFFGREDIGSFKTTAIYNRVYSLCSYFYYSANSRNFSKGTYLHPITIGALDNMQVRKDVFESWCIQYGNNPVALFIDGRLSADELQIFVIKGGDTARINEYKNKWLFTDEEGEHTLCSFKQTTYMASMIASLIGNVIVNHCANIANPDAMFDLPFYINYNAEMMYFKTVDL